MIEMRLYLAQRLSALVIAPLVLGHLGLMIWAIRGGLSAGEILSRTQGSVFWFCYYGLFVVAVAVHGAIGLRTIAGEWFGMRGSPANALALVFLAAALVLGGRAVIAVTVIAVTGAA